MARTDLTAAMTALLGRLQANASTFTPHTVVGARHCNASTADALATRGLAIYGMNADGQTIIAITEAGTAATTGR